MKKILASVLIPVMLLALTACGGNETAPPESPAAPPPAVVEPVQQETSVESAEAAPETQHDPVAKFLGRFSYHEDGVNHGAYLNIYFRADGTGVFNWLALPNTHIDWCIEEENVISISYQSIVEFMTICGTLDGDILTVIDSHFPDNLYIFIRDADATTSSPPPQQGGTEGDTVQPPQQGDTVQPPQQGDTVQPPPQVPPGGTTPRELLIRRTPPRGGFRRVLPEEIEASENIAPGTWATPFRRSNLNLIGTWWAYETFRPGWDEPQEQDWIMEFKHGDVFTITDSGGGVSEGTWRISGSRVALSGVGWLNGTWSAEIWIIDDYEMLSLVDPDDEFYLVRIEED